MNNREEQAKQLMQDYLDNNECCEDALLAACFSLLQAVDEIDRLKSLVTQAVGTGIFRKGKSNIADH